MKIEIETVPEQPLAAVLERVRQRDIGARVRPNLSASRASRAGVSG
jgi:hypothetical protein